MIYTKNNLFYVRQGNLYFLADIIIKKHTIIVMPTSEYVEELINAVEITYKDLKEKMINS